MILGNYLCNLLGRMYFKLIIVFHSLFSRCLVLYPDSPISTPNPFDRFLLQIHSLDKRSLSALSVLVTGGGVF